MISGRIGDQKLVLAVPKVHPLAMYDSVDLKDTVDYPQIYFQKGSGLRPVVDQMYEQISVFPKIAFEIEEDGSMQDSSLRDLALQSCRIFQS